MISPPSLTIQLDALIQFDTPTIANAMESLEIAPCAFTGPEIHAMTLGGPIAGIGVTGTMKDQSGSKFAHLEPWLRFLEEIEKAPFPVVAMLQDDSQRPGRDAMIGEGMSRLMRATGAVGVLCSGVIRDIASLQEMKFPVWASGLAADRGGIRFHRYQVPIEIAGMKVNPGDLIMADENGALIVPFDRLADLLAAAARVTAKEAKMFEMFSTPDFRVSQLYEFYSEALKSARSERGGEF
jgi:4-hydroxy-4-methyl-2-oxoglutarate aldolase